MKNEIPDDMKLQRPIEKRPKKKRRYKRFPAKKWLYFSLIIILLSSCSSVNVLTRLKRTPREYSLNYCYSDIRAPKSRLNGETWIVFSDRDKNDTYQNPGGKVKMKQMSFMEAFFVIREKGEYLQLVKYDADIVGGNPRARIMTDRKKAEYYGWVRRSNMLLTKQSSLDMATGFKNKAITMVADTFAISAPQIFFDSDSILTFRDENLTVPNSKIPVHEIVFILKASADGKKVLVSKKTQLRPEDAADEVPGWISVSIVKEIGQRLFVEPKSLNEDPSINELVFLDKNKQNKLSLNDIERYEIKNYSKNNPPFRFAPVRSYRTDVDTICFHTAFPTPLIDKSLNFVLNLNGNRIMYRDFLKLEENLRKLNVIFVFEFRERLLNEYPRLMSVVQNLLPLFNSDDDPYRYKFGAVLSYLDTISFKNIKSYGLEESFTGMMDFLMSEIDSVEHYRPIANSQAWQGLNKAVEMIEENPAESHLLIVIGESGIASEKADSLLATRIAHANGRILGYQVFNEKLSNYDNNFVLQIENLIENTGLFDVDLRRERLVYTSQFKPDIRYRESSRNVYAIDPERSMTQGWILFPAKSEEMQADILTQAIDTIVMEIRQDNNSVINHLHRAFEEFGDRFYRYTDSWTVYNNKDSLWHLNRDLLRRMPGHIPSWFMPSSTVWIDSTDKNLGYYLLLTESELKEVRSFLEDITRFEPDFKYKGKRMKVKRCNCPDDEITAANVVQNERVYDKNGDPVYLSTRNIRNNLFNTYRSRLLLSYKMTKPRPFRLRFYPLAKAKLEIVGNPAKNDIVKKYQIRDFKRKKRMRDAELDELILYFNQKKAGLENYLYTNGKSAFVSNGETYYWIDREYLP